ncbi:hypothetical protein [Microbacterium sp. SS28]|uniref:hypothetical protein n=1 Tax=Microbacterium sp. SS28 TaxID=2919948 RepID=UPI001FA9CAB4|nr:hypothetical protein [Microbacterium sp. SS28]
MTTLIVDLLALDSARIDVSRIHSEFTEAAARSDRLADAVGHPGLADRVHEFAGNWDQRRRELADQLATVRDHLQQIVSAFEETDAELARALTDQRESYPPAVAPEAV